MFNVTAMLWLIAWSWFLPKFRFDYASKFVSELELEFVARLNRTMTLDERIIMKELFNAVIKVWVELVFF